MEDISTLDAICQVGTHCLMDHMPEEAEEMYKRAIEGKKKVVGAGHPSTLDSLHDLAILYAERGRLTEAQEVLENVLKGYERSNGIDNTTIVTVVHSLGRLYRLQGNLSDAEKMLQRSVGAYEEIHGSDHFQTLIAFYNLGLVYQDQGKLREAEELFQKALIGLQIEFGCSFDISRIVRDSLDAIRKLREVGPSQAP